MCRLRSFIRHRINNSRGQAMILVATTFVVLFGFVTISTDFGHYMRERQRHQQALDAAALAGAQFLPFSRANAVTAADEFAQKNGLDPSTMTKRFGCFVKSSATDSSIPDSGEVFALCPQIRTASNPFGCNSGTCNCANQRCFHECNNGEDCNTIQVQAQRNVNFLLAPIYARLAGSDEELTNATVNLRSTACRGRSCGTPPDIAMVIILDRSNSMSFSGKFTEATRAASEILRGSFFRPVIHRIALAVTPGDNGNTDFILVDLTDDHDMLADTVESLQIVFDDTKLAGPIQAATNLLIQESPSITKQIVLLTDGAPNQVPTGTPACTNTIAAAEAARQAGIQVFAIHYGDPGNPERCSFPDQPQDATDLLADVADGTANHGTDCDAENSETDDDETYLCQQPGANLTPVFERIVTRILQNVGTGSSLLDNRLFN